MCDELYDAVIQAVSGTYPRPVPDDLIVTNKNEFLLEVPHGGPAIFAEHAKLIRTARSSICLQTFMWYESTRTAPVEPTDTLLQAFRELDVELQRDHGEVAAYILVDRYSNTAAITRSFNALNLRRVRVQVRGYPHVGRNLLHSKSLIVDARMALITGANVQAYYNADRTWHDAAFVMRGDVALSLYREFVDAWGEAGGFAPLVAAVHPPNQLPRTRAVLMGRPAGPWTVGGNGASPARSGYLAAFAAARQRIRIHTPNLNASEIVDAVVAAVNRSVMVELVLSKGFNDRPERFTGGDNEWTVARIRRRVREDRRRYFSAKWYCHTDRRLIDDSVDRQRRFASHAKYASVDSCLVIVGSTNMDTQSWKYSREVNVAICSAEVTAAWDRQFFEPSFARGRVIDPEDLSSSWWSRDLRCSVCGTVHGVMPSVVRRWHVCSNCEKVYCYSHGYALELYDFGDMEIVEFTARTRACGSCGEPTRLI